MRSHLHSRTRVERGAAAVEFGLISIVLLALLIGIIQFAIFFWAYEVSAHAAREGARLGAVDPCNTGAITALAENRLPNNLGAAATVTPPPSPVEVGKELTVSVRLDTLDTGFFPGFPSEVSKSATTRIEHVPFGSCTP